MYVSSVIVCFKKNYEPFSIYLPYSETCLVPFQSVTTMRHVLMTDECMILVRTHPFDLHENWQMKIGEWNQHVEPLPHIWIFYQYLRVLGSIDATIHLIYDSMRFTVLISQYDFFTICFNKMN